MLLQFVAGPRYFDRSVCVFLIEHPPVCVFTAWVLSHEVLRVCFNSMGPLPRVCVCVCVCVFYADGLSPDEVGSNQVGPRGRNWHYLVWYDRSQVRREIVNLLYF